MKVLGCRRNVNRISVKVVTTITSSTTILSTRRRITTTTDAPSRSKIRNPLVEKVTHGSTTSPLHRGNNSTVFNTTTVDPDSELQEEGLSVPVITLSVALLSSFLIMGGCFMYVQYRRGRGLCFGCFRRRLRPRRSPPPTQCPSPTQSTHSIKLRSHTNRSAGNTSEDGENTLFCRNIGANNVNYEVDNALDVEVNTVENIGPQGNVVVN